MRSSLLFGSAVAVCFAALTALPHTAAAEDLLETALNIRHQVNEQIRACGLEDVDAYDVLTQPQAPAHYAWVQTGTNHQRIVAFSYRATGAGVQKFEFKRLDGQTLGWILLAGDSYVEVGLPSGKVASMSLFYTPAGEGANYYCRSQAVTRDGFVACVAGQFMPLVASAVCSL